MQKLFKISFTLLILIAPSLSSANIGGYASLTNFSYEISGPGVSILPGSFINTSRVSIGSGLTEVTSTDLGPGFSFNFFNDFTNGANSATSVAKFAPGDTNSIISSSLDMADTAYSFMNTVSLVRFNYLANTTFTIYADAYASIFTDFDQQASAQSSLDFYTGSTSNNQSAAVAVIGSDPATDFDRISISFFSPNNEILTLSASSLVMANTATLPVPEPETYGMMLVGLSLIGFVARRRNKA
jgi:hypothetical protein